MKDMLDISRVEKIPMFFIVGRPRTGSTLLRTLFDAHPDVVIPQEWPMLLLLHMQFGKVRHWDKPTLEAFYEALFQPLRISYWSIKNWPSIDLDLLHANILQCEGKQTFETLIKVVYLHYNSFLKKKEIILIGDKNPATSNHTALLAEIFSTAKFIHLVRDYRDNLVSMLEVDFEMPNTTLLTYRWRYSYRKIEKCAGQHTERFYKLKYEALVKRPDYEFATLCNFLCIPQDNSIVEFYKRKDEIEATYPPEIIQRYFRSLMQPIDSRRVGIYKQKLTEKQIRIADLIAGSAAEDAGYERLNINFCLTDYLWVTPAILYTKGLYFVGKLVGVLPFKWMLWLMNKPSVIVSIYRRLFESRKK